MTHPTGLNPSAGNSYITAGHFAQLTSRLAMNNEDVVLAVVGDSTGNDPWEWVYQLTVWLGRQYPAYTVVHRLWNDTNQNYDAATIDNGAGGYTSGNVQTGTGSKTLTVYNASTPGMAAGYTAGRVSAQFPATPHCIVVNYGHNDASTTAAAYRPSHYALTRLLEDWFPTAGIVLIAQNARASTDSGYAAGLARNQGIIDLAATEGYGLVNVTQRFLDTPGYAANLLNGDGLHPNAAGSVVWLDEIQRHITKSRMAIPRTSAPRASRIFIPATSFIACEGSPTLSAQGPASAPWPAWSFDQSTQQGVCAVADWPDQWQQFNAYIVWSVATGSGYSGSTIAKWGFAISKLPQTGPFPSNSGTFNAGVPNNFSEATVTAQPSNSGAWDTVITRAAVNTVYGTIMFRPIGIRVRRIAADAADTLAETAYLRGVVIERAY